MCVNTAMNIYILKRFLVRRYGRVKHLIMAVALPGVFVVTDDRVKAAVSHLP